MIILALGPWQIVLVAVVILLIWGGKKIPELMKGLGGGIKEFKKASRENAFKKPAGRTHLKKPQKIVNHKKSLKNFKYQ